MQRIIIILWKFSKHEIRIEVFKEIVLNQMLINVIPLNVILFYLVKVTILYNYMCICIILRYKNSLYHIFAFN